MSDIATPVFRPTDSCIWNAFRNSGKARLILTGGGEAVAHPARKNTADDADSFVVNFDAPYGAPGCVIMASGMGKRFGGNKLMADFHGEPLISRALAATEGIFFRRVVVTRHADVAHFCRAHHCEVVAHELPDRSDTIRLGLEALGDVDGCLFCPGDQPLLRQETVASLALAAVNATDCIWRTAFNGTSGAPVLFPRWAFPELKTLPQGKGGGYLAKKYPERVRTIPVRDFRELKDVDRPEDLSELLMG